MRLNYSAEQMSYERVYLTGHVWSSVKVVGRGKGEGELISVGPYKFPSFFNLPLLSKWKMASIIKLSRENTELSLTKITSKRVGLAIKIRSWLQIFLVESLASTIWSAGYKHKVFFSSSFLGKIDYEVLWKLTDCSSWSLKPLWAFRNTAATFLFNAKFFFLFFLAG